MLYSLFERESYLEIRIPERVDSFDLRSGNNHVETPSIMAVTFAQTSTTDIYSRKSSWIILYFLAQKGLVRSAKKSSFRGIESYYISYTMYSSFE